MSSACAYRMFCRPSYQRPTAKELLQHRFIRGARKTSYLTELIERYQPTLWVHGHVHNSSDYLVGKTRVLCNPHGYGTENPDFNGALVVELET